ncbi:GGDEF domain-containing protein [Ideonella alba]|uniref:diguanylate cyclase n=1 Tax=Ideonella alba TaxID=2824118 RepID=A0A941BM18_9BURK|nr:diguanylate cyclase [Ideonella alba]MBQ0931789.1 diguanylate cyclase [Ideonella alba]
MWFLFSRRVVLAMALASWIASSANASAQRLRELEALAWDDPHRVAAMARAEAHAATDDETRFWALLAGARALDLLELEESTAQALDQAEQVLSRWAGATERHRLWLASSRLLGSWRVETPQQSLTRLDELRRRLSGSDDAYLACDLKESEVSVLVDSGSLDEAWLAAEDWERCARTLGEPIKQVWAIATFGTIAGRGQGRTQADPDEHYARAFQVLGDLKARTLRNALLYQRAEALRLVGRVDAASTYYRDSIALGREVGDEAAVAAGNIGLATIYLDRHEPTQALPLLREARTLLEPGDSAFRMFGVVLQLVRAHTQLRSAELPAAMVQARRYDTEAVPGADRAGLARVLAAAYASQGRFKEAYAETERAQALVDERRRSAAEVQNLRLQARYAAAQRDAENAELRHRGELAQAELSAQDATRRALWATVATLGALLMAAAGWAWSAIARRRALADLAMRDDLTGQPNRRAVTRHATEQFLLAREKGTPLTLALIDIDHFKRVNDVRGHAGGDAVLRALAIAGTAVMRSQDVLGRWGGEEWLLVLPGLRITELPQVFARLREKFADTPAQGIDGPHGVTFSMGGAELGPDLPHLDALIAVCDERLYRAKSAGRDRLCHEDIVTDAEVAGSSGGLQAYAG